MTPAPPTWRSSSEVSEQLTDLDRLLAVAAAAPPRDFAGRQHLRSLERHRAALLEERRAAVLLESDAQAELTFEGDPVRGGHIDAGFFGPFLTALQKFANAVGQAVAGTPTARAPIPRNIADESRLLIGAQFSGSYGVRFRFPTEEELGQTPGTSAPEILEVLYATFGQTVPPDDARAVIAVSRVRSHYKQLFRLLSEKGATATLRTRRAPLGVTVTPSRARERLEWIDLVQSTEREFVFRGILDGGSLSRRRFEIDDGENRYIGRVSERAVRQMKSVGFGDLVNATLRETRVEFEDDGGDPSQTYVLEAVRPAIDL